MLTVYTILFFVLTSANIRSLYLSGMLAEHWLTMLTVCIPFVSLLADVSWLVSHFSWSMYPGVLETDVSCFVWMMVHNNRLTHQPRQRLLKKKSESKNIIFQIKVDLLTVFKIVLSFFLGLEFASWSLHYEFFITFLFDISYIYKWRSNYCILYFSFLPTSCHPERQMQALQVEARL